MGYKGVSRLLAIVLASGFALALPPAVSADTLTLVTVDCGDGSPLQATLDADGLTALQSSLQAIIDNPAGLSCTLSTSPVIAPPLGTIASADSGRPFVVGGGRYARSGGCGINFNLSGHVDSDGVARGTVAFGINNAPGCDQGAVKAKVTCLNVNGVDKTAEVKGDVTQANGVLGGFQQSPPIVVFTDVQDNGKADTITQLTDPDQIDNACTAAPGILSADNGNITVHS